MVSCMWFPELGSLRLISLAGGLAGFMEDVVGQRFENGARGSQSCPRGGPDPQKQMFLLVFWSPGLASGSWDSGSPGFWARHGGGAAPQGNGILFVNLDRITSKIQVCDRFRVHASNVFQAVSDAKPKRRKLFYLAGLA